MVVGRAAAFAVLLQQAEFDVLQKSRETQAVTTVEDALRAVLSGTAADKLEGERLEFKEQHRERKTAFGELTDAAVCLANNRGGDLVVGVRDRPGGRDALTGCDLDTDELRTNIHERSQPHLLVQVEERQVESTRLLVVRVPEGLDVYSNVSGRATRRSGARCLPLLAEEAHRLVEDRRGTDWSSFPSELGPDLVAERTASHLRELVASSPRAAVADLARAPLHDLLSGIGAMSDRGTLTRAAALALAGDDAGPTRIIYQYRRLAGSESTTVLRAAGPLITAVRSTFDAFGVRQESAPLNLAGGQQVSIETYPTGTFREALLNAVVHGDLRTGQPVQVDHSTSAVTVTSPGPLVAGVTPTNILTRGPKPRFRALSDLFLKLGLVEDVGAGVKRMYRDMLRAGQEAPLIEDLNDRVVVTLTGQRPDGRIARFVRDLPNEAGTDVDTLLTVRTLCQRRTVSAATLAPVVQRDHARTLGLLRTLATVPFDLIEPTPGTLTRRSPNYQLRAAALAALGPAVRYHRASTDQIERAVVDHVRDYGWINSGSVQRTFDVDVYRASHMLRSLVAREVLVKTSAQARGTAVSYGPGPAFPARRARRGRADGSL